MKAYPLANLFLLDLALIGVLRHWFGTWDFYAIAFSSHAATVGTIVFFCTLLALALFAKWGVSDKKLLKISLFQILFAAFILFISFIVERLQ